MSRINIIRYMETHVATKQEIIEGSPGTPEELKKLFEECADKHWKGNVGVLVDMADGKFALAHIVDTWWTERRKGWKYPELDKDGWEWGKLGMMGFLAKFPVMQAVYLKALTGECSRVIDHLKSQYDLIHRGVLLDHETRQEINGLASDTLSRCSLMIKLLALLQATSRLIPNVS